MSDHVVTITAEQYDKLLRLWDREQMFCKPGQVAETDLWVEGAQKILGKSLPKSWRRGDKIKLIVGGKHSEERSG